MCSIVIDWFFLAEKVYANQLRFIGKRFQIIENKAIIPDNLLNKTSTSNIKTTFVYSGTIAEHYGIFEALRFIERLYQRNKNIELTIIGFAPDKKVFQKVRHIVDQKIYIKTLGGDAFIPHDQILKEISLCDFCLMPYRKNKATECRIPTKLFECLAMEKPVIISPDALWESIVNKNNAGIVWDFKEDNLPSEELLSKSFYGNDLALQHQWISESVQVSEAVIRLI
jgi:glycosyltransferase involved in cell wall biosynthesis